MSHEVESTAAQPSDLGIALGVLGMFILFLVVFLGSTSTIPSTTTANNGQDNTQVAIAPTVQPTSTSLPPTATPTATTPPTATNTPQPSPTSIPLTATDIPQATAEEVAESGTTTTAYDPELVAQGQQLFITCTACHGPDARGIPGLGKDLVNSEFMHSLSDQELVDFIKTGRPIWDPLNTTGVDMPPRGGNPTLTDEDLLAIVVYLRSLTAENGTGG
jgi:disulfide bond formation protein DsbB